MTQEPPPPYVVAPDRPYECACGGKQFTALGNHEHDGTNCFRYTCDNCKLELHVHMPNPT